MLLKLAKQKSLCMMYMLKNFRRKYTNTCLQNNDCKVCWNSVEKNIGHMVYMILIENINFIKTSGNYRFTII